MAEAHSFRYEGSRGQVLFFHESDHSGPNAAELKVVSADGSEQVISGSNAAEVRDSIDTDHTGTLLAYNVAHSPLAQIALTQEAVSAMIDEGLV